YMDMLSKGINPISKEKYQKNSDINNERLLKCFEFVSGILERVIIETEEKEKISENSSAVLKEKTEKNNQNEMTAQDSNGFVNTLVSEDVKGDAVVELLISKGVLKQGISKKE
ncbi:MAG: hypothetical protein J6V36_01570, partial [Clostridia bacterium]|nr:hypothetical protein [Clostridia bacterium]